MRVSKWIANLALILSATVALAQPPKASVPRNLPEGAESLPIGKEDVKTTPALIKIKLPEAATIWFENQKMSQSGSTRIFQSPALEPKKTYYYKVKVAWPTGVGTMSKEFVSEQEVAVKAGETTSIDFTPLVSHTREVKPTTTREMIRQAAHNTPAPDKSKHRNP